MSGFYQMRRGWQRHPVFRKEKFSTRDAWCWLIENAAWKEHEVFVNSNPVTLERGQLVGSYRTLADAWGWSVKRVRTVLKRFENGHMMGTATGTGVTIITICNYDKYQTTKEKGAQGWEANGHGRGTRGAQSEEREEGKEEKEYKFEGAVIRLTAEHYDRWHESYPAVDLKSALQSRDDWLANEAGPSSRKNWFVPTSNWLANKQKEAVKVEREMEEDWNRV